MIDYLNEEKIWSDTAEYKITNTGEIVSGDGYVTNKIYIPEGTTTVTLKKLGGNYTWIGLVSFAEDNTALYYEDQNVAELSFNIADYPTSSYVMAKATPTYNAGNPNLYMVIKFE